MSVTIIAGTRKRSQVRLKEFLAPLKIKICKLYQRFSTASPSLNYSDTLYKSPDKLLTAFSHSEPGDISDLITKSNASSCMPNPAPSPFHSNCLSVISTPICHLIYTSLASDNGPSSPKTAPVTPILLNLGLDLTLTLGLCQ